MENRTDYLENSGLHNGLGIRGHRDPKTVTLISQIV